MSEPLDQNSDEFAEALRKWDLDEQPNPFRQAPAPDEIVEPLGSSSPCEIVEPLRSCEMQNCNRTATHYGGFAGANDWAGYVCYPHSSALAWVETVNPKQRSSR